MGRATGIHLILATQQAHAKTISGIMNVNFSNRLAFRTETKKDSWDILFESGCENLLGKGDAILSYHNNGGVLHRIQTPYISDVELKKLVK
jgi:S-DNA-T family DNA segregation ATPase FtsK/SpoIIIE